MALLGGLRHVGDENFRHLSPCADFGGADAASRVRGARDEGPTRLSRRAAGADPAGLPGRSRAPPGLGFRQRAAIRGDGAVARNGLQLRPLRSRLPVLPQCRGIVRPADAGAIDRRAHRSASATRSVEPRRIHHRRNLRRDRDHDGVPRHVPRFHHHLSTSRAESARRAARMA